VLDFDGLYDVNPLLEEGITGAGRTIGIVTLAAFTPDDEFVYWKSLGLKVNPNRITIVNVDGGPGAPSDVSGSDETTIDVEQSGGIAPGANIVVYQAPNTSQGFVDVFAKAVDDNTVDTMSTSFGSPEAFNDLAVGGPVTDPFNGTSFVGPQLDGVTDLLSQKARRRLGLLTVPLYALQRLGFSHGPAPVLHTISTGDNWFFQGRDGYSPAAGLGTLDVFNFSRVLAPSLF
jgi:subtilase family serine protease